MGQEIAPKISRDGIILIANDVEKLGRRFVRCLQCLSPAERNLRRFKLGAYARSKA
jgi:hypothetical protein